MNKIHNVKSAFAISVQPPPDLTISQWADKYRYLPKVSSSEHGLWRTKRFPFLREIMDELSPQSSVSEVVVMKGAQVGCTELCINRMFYTIDYHPVPYLYIQKTVDAVEKFSKQRLSPSIDVCPRIKRKIQSTKSRDSSNTITLKAFPGGILVLGGANSAASLRSMPISNLDVDEQDSYEIGIQDEGDPTELAYRRTANFPRRKVFKLSTPKLKETSKIEPAFLEGDQRLYFVICPFCGHMAPFAWSESGELKCFTIHYDNDDPKTVHTVCADCGCVIEERYKTYMMAEENGACWVPQNPGVDVASFHLSSLYSPIGFYSWDDAVALWLKAQRNFDKELLRVFINTVLGETYSIVGKVIEAANILTRREHYCPVELQTKWIIPMDVKFITAATDIQDQFVQVEIIGWGRNEESWAIETQVIQGDTELDFVWDMLDQFLMTPRMHESGVTLHPVITMIDSGYKTRKAYTFCRLREHRRVYPVKGVGGWGKGLIKRPNKRNDDGVFLFIAYVDEIKTKFYSQLKITTEDADGGKAGLCHFPMRHEYDRNYFRQLTSEKLSPKVIRGFTKLEWELPKGRRNEALDIRVYSIAGCNVINPNFDVIDKQGGLMSLPLVGVKKKKRILSRGQ
jgi:phage terminase large subunit GpA-like protein